MGQDILTFIGLAVVVEGVLMALFPGALQRMMAEMANFAPERLRRIGLIASVAGTGFLFALVHLTGDAAGGGADAGALGFSAFRSLLAGLP